MNEKQESGIVTLNEQDDDFLATDIQEACNQAQTPVSLNSINLI